MLARIAMMAMTTKQFDKGESDGGAVPRHLGWGNPMGGKNR